MWNGVFRNLQRGWGDGADPGRHLEELCTPCIDFLNYLKNTWREKTQEIRERCPKLCLLDPKKVLQIIFSNSSDSDHDSHHTAIAVNRLLWHCFPNVVYDVWFQAEQRHRDSVLELVSTMKELQLYWMLPTDLLENMPDPAHVTEGMQKDRWVVALGLVHVLCASVCLKV